MQDLPFVSIIIPCRNEEEFVGKCLDSLFSNDYPKDKMEVFVIDGMSKDGTREVLKRYQKKYPFINILENQKKIVPVALNMGIKKARSDIIIRMDAHATYKKDYILKSVTYLKKYDADNIGGIWVIIPRNKTLVGKAIAKTMSSPFGTGDAYYKIGAEKLRIVDTVPFGCYKKEVFKKIGFFNENLARSQDMEFNLRLKKAGGRIFLFPEIVGYYYVRSTLKSFFAHNFIDGIWIIYPLKFTKILFRPRHYIPFIFISTLLIIGVLGIFFPIFFWLFLFLIALYFLVTVYFSIKIALKEKELGFLFLLPLVFAIRHFGYGLGSIWGLIKLFAS